MAVRLNPPKDGRRYKVITYERVSLSQEDTGSHTFETQAMRIRERLEQLCGAHGYDALELKDDGVSGGYGPVATALERRTRPQVKRLVEELETGTYDALIVYSFNRFARSARWWHQLLEDAILGTKTSFVSVTQPWDLGNPDDRMIAGVQALFDGHYRDMASQRNKDAALTRAQLGFPLGDVGYGWQWEPREDVPKGGRRRIFPVPEEGQWLIWMKDRYLAGANFARIAAELNERGVPTRSGVAKWRQTYVWQLLHGPLHAGLVSSALGPQRGEHFERRYWDPEVSDQIAETCASRRKWAKTNTAKDAAHLLNGIAGCARCGKRLYSESQQAHLRYYYCRTGHSEGKRTCSGVRAKEEKIDAAVVEQLARLAQDPQMQALLHEEAERAAEAQDAGLKAEAAQLRSTIAAVVERREALLDALVRKTITDDRYQEYEPKLLAEQSAAEAHLARTEGELANRQRREAWAREVKETVLQFPLVWKHLQLHERREVLCQLLEVLTMDREGQVVTLCVKLHLLPEQTVRIDLGKRPRAKKRHQTGVLSLTPRELAALHWLGEGKTPQETAVLMGVNYHTVRQWLFLIRKKMGTEVLADILVQTRARVRHLLPTLPLGHLNAPMYEGEAVRPSAKLLEVLPFLANGASNAEAARELGLPESTISGRRQGLFNLLGVKTAYQLGQKARQLGLL